MEKKKKNHSQNQINPPRTHMTRKRRQKDRCMMDSNRWRWSPWSWPSRSQTSRAEAGCPRCPWTRPRRPPNIWNLRRVRFHSLLTENEKRGKSLHTQSDVVVGVLVDHPLEDLGGLQQLFVEVLVRVDRLFPQDLLDIKRGRTLLLFLALALFLLLLKTFHLSFNSPL